MSARNRLYRERLRAGRKCFEIDDMGRDRTALARSAEADRRDHRLPGAWDALARSGVTRTSERAECPLLRSLLGVKRTWLFALHMSANDPKRTSAALQQRRVGFAPKVSDALRYPSVGNAYW